MQTECQDIEEVLGKIGRQASDISITKESSGKVNITLTSLNAEADKISYEDNKLIINDKEYSNNVKEFSITPDHDSVKLFSINMVLEKGYYKSKVTYPVKSSILLRNKNSQ